MRLFEPGKIGKLQTKNRIVMAPMMITGGLTEPDGRLSQQGIDYYAARARGGTGLIITSVTFASREIEPSMSGPLPCHLMADNTMYIPRLNQLAETAHDYGAKVAVQLTPGLGRVSARVSLGGDIPAAPSALPCFWNPRVTTRELTIGEIERLVESFEFAARIVRTAEIDAIEIHGHEGYLLDEFMTPLWNKRTDKYGGDLDGRMRFPLEIIEAARRGAGADFPIIFRFGITHYLEGGREIEEGLEIARRIEAAGVDALDVDAGCYETWHWAHPPTSQPPGCMVDMAEMTKKVVNIPVMAVGKLGYPELAESVLQEEKADYIILGRALLADPEWPNKVRDAKLEDIRPCIGCQEGCMSRGGKHISCAVNPQTGIERELAINPAEKGKTVLVVGGGPGGMEAARIAALRGHKVTLIEKGDALGGNLIPASAPDFKQDYRNLIKYLSTQIKKLGVTIELGKEATVEQIRKLAPEVIFIATGSTPIVPEIPGVVKGKVVTATDVLTGKKKAGESVVVIGGGLVGCETALDLAQKGKNVTIIEILGRIARDMHATSRQHILELLADSNAKIMTETSVAEIKDDSVVIVDKSGNRSELENDTVVIALGLKSNRELAEALQDTVPETYVIGDCVEPRKVINAIWEGFRFARLI